ncbi:MAG: hypothetical protein KGZ86_00810 [Candidatus Latescibacteria bacterium]|nr:hypothetical protein [Candidatus Latescibacterota bacterium]
MTINEPIAVDCVFKNPGMEPRYFKWRNRSYRIMKINGRWHRRQGKFMIYCFAVSDEHNNAYELELDTEEMKWQLLKIDEE